MSVIVKGLDLPACKEGYKNRYVCMLVQNSDGTTDLYVADKKYPVSTVPTPHGRLIDADKFKEEIESVYEDALWLKTYFEFLDEAPTIIEAEVSE